MFLGQQNDVHSALFKVVFTISVDNNVIESNICFIAWWASKINKTKQTNKRHNTVVIQINTKCALTQSVKQLQTKWP